MGHRVGVLLRGDRHHVPLYYSRSYYYHAGWSVKGMYLFIDKKYNYYSDCLVGLVVASLTSEQEVLFFGASGENRQYDESHPRRKT